jgi:hypothetical protein
MFQKVTNVTHLPPGECLCTLIEDPEHPGQHIWFWQSRSEFLRDKKRIRLVVSDPYEQVKKVSVLK